MFALGFLRISNIETSHAKAQGITGAIPKSLRGERKGKPHPAQAGDRCAYRSVLRRAGMRIGYKIVAPAV